MYRFLAMLAAAVIPALPVLAAPESALRVDFTPSLAERKSAQSSAEVTFLTVPKCATAPTLDGNPNDAVWAKAARIPEFRHAGLPTEVKLCYDDRALYIAVTCQEKPGRKPVAAVTSHDGQVWKDDCIEIRVMPGLGKTGYHFAGSISGATYDASTTGGGNDTSYDPAWTWSVQRGEKGWTAEAALPLEALGLTAWYDVIHFNIGRTAPGAGSTSWAAQYGDASSTALRLEGAPKRPELEAEQAESRASSIATEGRSVEIAMDRFEARPGERWLDGVVRLRPVKGKLDQSRLQVKLLPLSGDKPVETLSVTPTGGYVRLSADLRRDKLQKAELSVELFEGNERTGAAKALIGAAPSDDSKPGQKIEIALDTPPGLSAKEPHPLTFGVPFAAGSLWDVTPLRLVNKAGRELPAQKEITGRWAREGSIQWVRFDVLAVPEEGCFVEVAAPEAAPANALKLTEENGKIIVETGAARYVLAAGNSPIEEVTIAGRKAAWSAGARGLYVIDSTGRTASASADGATMKVESRGPVASCVRIEGLYKTPDGVPLARHITRVECHAGQALAQVTHTLILIEDTNKLWFREVGWELAVDGGAAAKAIFGTSSVEPEKSMTAALDGPGASAWMLQDSHFRFGSGKNHFSVATGKGTVTQGEECGDWAALAGPNGGAAFICREAARQHPKEFEVFPNKIVLKLFSNRAGEELDFRTPTLVQKWNLQAWYDRIRSKKAKTYDPNYGEKMSQAPSNAIGWAKTHTIAVLPLGPQAPEAAAARAARTIRTPVYALASPEWTYATKAMGPLYPKDRQRFPEIEAAQDSALKFWIERDRAWGENGFIDYNAGPHLAYKQTPEGPMVEMFRYCYNSYTVRSNLWRVYARSGDRAARDYVAGSCRSLLDNVHMHVDPPKDSGLVRGLYRSNNEPYFGLPLYWGGRVSTNTLSSSNMNMYIWLYQLTGDRRAKECIEEYIGGIKSWWTPANAQRDWRILMLFRHLAQAYSFTWDPELRDLMDATADLFQDEGAVGLSKYRPYQSSTYKTHVDVRALIDAWEITGSPRYRQMATTLAKHHWNIRLGTYPFNYCDPLPIVAEFLYNETGNPMYAQSAYVALRDSLLGYDPQTRKWPPRSIESAAMASFVFEVDYALDLTARSGADRKLLTSWIGYADNGEYTAVYVRKPGDAGLNLFFQGPSVNVAGHASTEGKVAGAVDGVRVGGFLQPKNNWGQDVNCVTQNSLGTGVVRLPKDAPGGVYSINFTSAGKRTFFADRRVPLVLHAPGAFYPAPVNEKDAAFGPQTAACPPRYYFSVPKDSQGPQIFFEGTGRLFTPDGKPVGGGKPLTGWIDLPVEKAGLWAFEPLQALKVQVKNLPPFFAVDDPQCFFIPAVEGYPKDAPKPTRGHQAGNDDDD